MFNWGKIESFIKTRNNDDVEVFLTLLLSDKKIFLEFYRANPIDLEQTILDKYAEKIYLKYLFEPTDSELLLYLFSKQNNLSKFKYKVFALNIENNDFLIFSNELVLEIIKTQFELVNVLYAILKVNLFSANEKNIHIFNLLKKYEKLIPKVTANIEKFEYDYFTLAKKNNIEIHGYYEIMKNAGANSKVLDSIEGRLFYTVRHGYNNETLIKILNDDDLLNVPRFKAGFMFEFLNTTHHSASFVYNSFCGFFTKRINEPLILDVLDLFLTKYSNELKDHLSLKKNISLEDMLEYWMNNSEFVKSRKTTINHLLLKWNLEKKLLNNKGQKKVIKFKI
jgi:hypothetical protein